MSKKNVLLKQNIEIISRNKSNRKLIFLQTKTTNLKDNAFKI